MHGRALWAVAHLCFACFGSLWTTRPHSQYTILDSEFILASTSIFDSIQPFGAAGHRAPSAANALTLETAAP